MPRRIRYRYRNAADGEQLRVFCATSGDSTIDVAQMIDAADAWHTRPLRQPRRRWVRLGIAILAIVMVALPSMSGVAPTAQATSAWQGLEALLAQPPQSDIAAPDTAGDATPADVALPFGSTAQSTVAPTVFAYAHGIHLHLPVADPMMIGFHEARGRRAVELQPVGQLMKNANARLVAAPSDQVGPAYVVMGSRGLPHPPLSAVDIALPSEAAVLAPVNGTVTDVSSYLLYGRYADVRIEIQPDGADHLRIAVLHLSEATVGVGDHVVAHETTIASQARRFAFSSQLDRHTPGIRVPHVHIEVLQPAR